MATGRRSVATVPKDIVEALNRGVRETKDLVEALAMNMVELAANTVPGFDDADRAQLMAVKGVVRQMEACGRLLAERVDKIGMEKYIGHASDTVRGWAAYATCRQYNSLPAQLKAMRTLADDAHFGVREWAWMAARPWLAKELERSVALLEPWTRHRSYRVRRFAAEVLRPCGVWCAHLTELKKSPEIGLRLLEPLRADDEKYVQDSVANWLNDASKSQPDWVKDVTDRWTRESKSPSTARIVTRALRSLTSKKPSA